MFDLAKKLLKIAQKNFKEKKNLRDAGKNNKMVGFDDTKEKVAQDEALQSRQYVTVDMMVLEAGL